MQVELGTANSRPTLLFLSSIALHNQLLWYEFGGIKKIILFC